MRFTTMWYVPFGVSKLKRRLHSLIRVYTCQNTTLLEIMHHGTKFYVCADVCVDALHHS